MKKISAVIVLIFILFTVFISCNSALKNTKLVWVNYSSSAEFYFNALNRDIVLDYYNTWYTPDNTVTVIAGDVDVNETMQLVSKYYNK